MLDCHVGDGTYGKSKAAEALLARGSAKPALDKGGTLDEIQLRNAKLVEGILKAIHHDVDWYGLLCHVVADLEADSRSLLK